MESQLVTSKGERRISWFFLFLIIFYFFRECDGWIHQSTCDSDNQRGMVTTVIFFTFFATQAAIVTSLVLFTQSVD